MREAHDNQLAELDLWVDGALSESEAIALGQRLEHDRDLQVERHRLEALREALVQQRVEPPDGFADAVMARLPQRHRRTVRPWALAAAATLAVGLGAAGMLRWGLRGAAGDGALAPLLTVGDFFATVLLAGSGLLAASWRGVGQLVAGWLGESPVNLVVGVVLVVGVNLLLVSLLRRRALAAQRVKADRHHE